MTQRADEALERGSRCALAARGPHGPLLAPMAFWFDGVALWMSTLADSVEVAALAADARCAAYVPPLASGGIGAVVSGRARVFSLTDPLGLALHGASVSAAMTALAARNAGSILGYAQDAAHVPARLVPRNRVALRLVAERLRGVRVPAAPPGIAPALPTVVPPEVRRALAGRRDVVVAAQGGDALTLGPAVWGAGFSLHPVEGVGLREGAAGAVLLNAEAGRRPTTGLGMVVHGELVAGPALRPQRVTWWRGSARETAEVPVAPAGAVTLPD